MDSILRVPAYTAAGVRLGRAVSDLYAQDKAPSLLRNLLGHSARLAHTVAGSVSAVDADHGRYAKIAETGASCQVGKAFPLEEGATGRAFHRRTPVVIEDYAALPDGHLAVADPARSGAAVAIPMWWRGDIVAVNVVFAGRSRRFGPAEVDALDLLTQSAAAALMSLGALDPAPWSDAAPQPGRTVGTGLFTVRERQVLDLVGLGLTDREIGSRLAISPRTVEKHVGSLLKKTGASSRTGAVVRATEQGWL